MEGRKKSYSNVLTIEIAFEIKSETIAPIIFRFIWYGRHTCHVVMLVCTLNT